MSIAHEVTGTVEQQGAMCGLPIVQPAYEHTAQMTEFITALAKAQGEMGHPIMDGTNPHFQTRYASLASVRNAVMPALTANGIAVTQLVQAEGQRVSCVTILWHTSGQYLKSILTLPVSKADAQGIGGGMTYARRYSLAAICNVVGEEDDDGNSAVHEDKPTTQVIHRPRPSLPPPAKVKATDDGPPAPPAALKMEIKTLLDGLKGFQHAGLTKAVMHACFGVSENILGRDVMTLQRGLALFRHLCGELATHGTPALHPDSWVAQEVRRLAQDTEEDDAESQGPTWGQMTVGSDDIRDLDGYGTDPTPATPLGS